ncbi:MAG: hypothetical protein OEX12_00360 [Gammaproteobacteria bacterium]|nr:hypothetical protein [Gammaproteobacteria bacterium]
MAEKKLGAFASSLQRNNKQIRNDRAEAMTDSAHMIMRRKIEDLQVDIKTLNRDREALLDLSPESATSLMLKKDFNAELYVEKEMEYGIQIRQKEILLDLMQKRYTYLFGEV